MPGNKFFNQGHTQREWGSYIYPKAGFVEALKQQLRTFTPDKAWRTEWGDGWILMSFLTDCYTPIEGKEKITRECLKLLLEAGHKVRIQTRSALVERDFDILKAHRQQVLLGTSLPYLHDALARVLEPRAPGPGRRVEMLYRAREREIPVFVALAPFMPWSDWKEMAVLLGTVTRLDPREIFCEVLNPKGDNLEMMKAALWEHSPAFDWQHRELITYDEVRWAMRTAQILRYGSRQHPRFIPWPDTRRSWAKHLPDYQVEWLDRFLPQPAMEKQMTAA